MSYTSYSPETDLPVTGTGQSGAGRTGADPGGAGLAVAGSTGEALGLVLAGMQGGVDVRGFQAGIEAGQRALGNRAFVNWVEALQSGEREAPLQLMGKKKKKPVAAELEAGSGEQAAGATGAAGTGAEGTVVPGPEAAQPQATGTTPGVEPEPREDAAGGVKKKKKKSRVQVALNTLREEGVAAFRGYVEAEIGETGLLRTLEERITRAEDLAGVVKEALGVVEGRMRLLDPLLPASAGASCAEIAVIAPVKSNYSLREMLLFDACGKGDTGQFKRYLGHVKPSQRNVDVNVSDEYGTLLGHAAYDGHAGIVEALLRRPDIDVNLGQHLAATPLFCAAQLGHAEVVKLLLDARGINVNLATSEGATPLYIAAQNGRVEVVRLLLAAPGINVNLRTLLMEGTPLTVALQEGHVEVAKLLLAAPGIDIHVRAADGATTLYVAAQHDTPGIVEQLVRRGADVNLALTSGETPLGAAAYRGYVGVVRTLLQAPGIEVDKANISGITALSATIVGGYKDIVSLLLRKRADPNKPDLKGITPLHYACLYGDMDIVEMLLHEKGDPDAEVGKPGAINRTPYNIAELMGRRSIMGLLERHRQSQAALAVGVEALPGKLESVDGRSAASPDPPGQTASADKSPSPPSTPLAQAKVALRQEVLRKHQADNFDMEAGIHLLEDINDARDLDRMCALYNRLAHIERQEERALRRGRRTGLYRSRVTARARANTAAPVFALGGKTGLDAERVEDGIKRHLLRKYHRFVSQAVNDMEFGRGKPTTGHKGLWHASAGIPGVGSCSVFYYLEGPGESIRIVGIGHHVERAAYRLDYATEELGGSGHILRIA